MYFNNFISGPTKPANVQQPNTQAPAPVAGVGNPLPPPVPSIKPGAAFIQPDYRVPATNPEVASFPAKNGNPMANVFPLPKAQDLIISGVTNEAGRGPVAGPLPVAIATGWNWQKS
jgi:hypothetical protein